MEIAREADIFDDDVEVGVTEEGIKVASKQIQDRGADLLVRLRDSNIGIKGFYLHEPTLDDVFLTITGEHISGQRGNELEVEK